MMVHAASTANGDHSARSNSDSPPERADAVIIGAGIIGGAIALELSKRGYRTVNVDRLPAAGYGPTGSSCAIVRAHYSSRQGVAMAYECFSYWQDWERYIGVEDELGLARFIQCGTVVLNSSNGHHHRFLPHYRALGVEHEEWSTAELKERFPLYDVRSFWPPKRPDDPRFWDEPEEELLGAVFTPGSGYVSDPQLAAHNVQRAAEAHGARFLFRTQVVAIDQLSGRVAGVRLAGGQRIHSPIVVNVAGPHSFLVNRMAGVDSTMRVKTRALRHEVHQVPAPADFDPERHSIQTADGDTGIYFRPAPGNQILVGSEDPECDERTWIEDPDVFDRHITEAQWEAQVFRLARRIPSLKIPLKRKGIADLYDVSDDWIPIYDKSDLPGFYMAVGTSGNQFKNAPVVGYLMAELIEQVQAGHDHDADHVRRPALYTGVELDLGFYSRLREINRESSYSVNG